MFGLICIGHPDWIGLKVCFRFSQIESFNVRKSGIWLELDSNTFIMNVKIIKDQKFA